MRIAAITSFQKTNKLQATKPHGLKHDCQNTISFTQKAISTKDFSNQDFLDAHEMYTRYQESSKNLEKEFKRLDYYLEDAAKQKALAAQNVLYEFNPRDGYQLDVNKFIEYWDETYYPKKMEIKTPSGFQQYEYYMNGKIKEIQMEDFNNKESVHFLFKYNDNIPFYTEISYYDKILKETVKTIKTQELKNTVFSYNAGKQNEREEKHKHLYWFVSPEKKECIYIVNKDERIAFMYDKFGIPKEKILF